MPVPHSNRTSGPGNQANRPRISSPDSVRRGFSLIELLIVIAILTIVTAFVLPAVQGPLERSRLRSAAVDIQKAWGTARTLAIREGMAMEFRCELDGRRWKIERAGGTVKVITADDELETPSGLTADSDPAGGPDSADDRPDHRRLMREGSLPQGVTFADLSFLKIGSAPENEFNVEFEEETMASAYGSRWSEPLRFRPEGRSQDASLRIGGADRFAVDVNIRGLTSAVGFSAPYRRSAAEDELGRGL